MVTFATEYPERPLRLKKVAEFYDVNRRTVESWINHGLPAQRIGKLIFIYLSDVERFSQRVVMAAADSAVSETQSQRQAREAIEGLRSLGYKI